MRPYGEQLITTGPLTRLHAKIFGNYCWALALARSHERWDVGRRRRRLRHNAQRQPLPIAAALFPTAGFTLCAAPPALTRLPAPPAPRGPAARRATVTALRMCRPIAALAAFEQALPAPKMPRPGDSLLFPVATSGILKGAQGRLHSRRSSLGGELQLPPRRFHLDTTTLQSNACGRDLPYGEALAGRRLWLGIDPRNAKGKRHQTAS
jgi:hypothetical protein